MRLRATGFTLVEILVVLVITVVLAAITIAVMGHVQENGRRTVCQNQLKQLALATQQYSQDSDGYYPDAGFQSQLSPYIKSSGLIECPTHQVSSLPVPGGVGSRFHLWGYNYNGVQLNEQVKEHGNLRSIARHEASLANASTIWVFGDDRITSFPGNGGGGLVLYSQCGKGGGFWPTLHGGGANYSFVDGHVKWLTPTAVDQLACSGS